MKRGGARHDVPPAQHGQHWVTLSNKRRVLLDDEGRIRRGLPAMFSNVDVRDVSELHRRVRDLEDGARECEADLSGHRAARTFRTTEDGVRALLRSNATLVEFLEQECSHDCERYRTWVRRGRRGSKPPWRPGDGRFDALQVGLDLKGARKISSWLEAVYVTIPPSRRWSDFAVRLQYLVDATGLSLMLPEEAEELVERRDEREHCQRVADERIEELILLARSARLTGAMADPDVPF
jgi:hypothetical protein